MNSILLAAGTYFDKLGNYTPILLMLGGLGLASYLLMRNNFRRRAKEDSRQEVRETRALLGDRGEKSELADAPVEVLRWQVEMHTTARELKGELDSKIMLVQALLNEVREERERLEKILAQSQMKKD